MAFNYKPVQAEALAAIKEFGIKIVLFRNNATVAKSMGVFVNATNNDFDGSGNAPISGVASAQRLCLLPGSIKAAPEVSDVIICAQGTFVVLEVEVVQPADVAVLYKCRITQ